MTIQTTPKKAITDRDVEAAQPGSELQDLKQPALRLRVSPKGKKVWIAFFWNPQTKKPTRSVVGVAEGDGWITVKEARLKAAALVAESGSGVKAAKPTGTPTFGEIVDTYAEDHWVRVWFERYCADWASKRLDAITQDMVEHRERQILRIAGERQKLRDANGGHPERNKPGATSVSRVGKALRTIYKLAKKKRGYKGDDMGEHMTFVPPKPRRRVFTQAEEKRFFAALESPTLSPWVKDFFSLLYWTGARWGNLKAARWEEFDFDAKEWIVPDHKHKNEEQAVKDLTDEAVAILKGMLEKRVDNNPWLFPATKNPRTHLTDITWPWKKVKELADLRAFTPHDIRRSFGSAYHNLGVPMETIAEMMGHKDANTTRSYYAVTYRETRRKALALRERAQ